MNSNFFGRQVQIFVTSDNEQIVIPQDIDTQNNLQIDFDIKSTLTGSSAPKNEVSITNLSEKTRVFFNEKQDIQVFAGYKQQGVARIGAGQISDIAISRETTDIITRLQYANAIFDINNLIFNQSYQGSITLSTILTDAFKNTDFTFKNFSVIPNITFSGFSFNGKTKDLLARLLTPNKINWVVLGDNITFNKVGQTVTDDVIFNFSKNTGLVSTPKKTQNGGVEFKTLLNTTIALGDKVNLDSQFIKGEFKVISLQHKGSSRGGDFTTTLDCVKITS